MTGSLDPLFQSVFPIVCQDENGRYIVDSTAFLAEHLGTHFLLTAAHALRGFSRAQCQPYVLLADKAIPLDEPGMMSPEKGPGSDLDVAYFCISHHAKLMSHLSAYKTISMMDYIEGPSSQTDHYFVFGYPSRSAHWERSCRMFEIKPLTYLTNRVCDETISKSLGIRNEDHLVVSYNLKMTRDYNGAKRIPPKPNGVSGGPLFRAVLDGNGFVRMLILEGLLTDWHRNKWMIATKKGAIRQFIDGTISHCRKE